jgi:hypothetical protein
MRVSVTSSLLACATLLLAAAALGGEGIQVRITNDGTQDVVVTVYDMNANPEWPVLENARLNGFTSVPISLIGDATGRARLAWTATSSDGVSRKCGHDDANVGDDSAVNVHADSNCSV